MLLSLCGDGAGCVSDKQLPEPMTDDLEMRTCAKEGHVTVHFTPIRRCVLSRVFTLFMCVQPFYVRLVMLNFRL